MLLEELAHAQLVGRVDDRPEQAHGDGLNPDLGHPGRRLLDRPLVEWAQDPPLGVDPLGELKGQLAGDVAVLVALAPVERPVASTFPDQQHVAVPERRQQGSLGGAAGEDRIGRPRRAVDQHLDLGEQLGAIHLQRRGGLLKDLEDADDRIGGRGRSLEDPYLALALQRQIGKRPSGVDCAAHLAAFLAV